MDERAVSPLVTLGEGIGFVARPELVDRLGPGWQALRELPVTIIVGVTGVGKSTALECLAALGRTFSLLPNRRVVADEVIIGTIQALDGQAPHPVTDRVTRLDYTARYRRLFPGGIAHALTGLVIATAQWPPPLLFDGLRGIEEVGHAATVLPRSRFIVLHAPDEVRVARLLGRDDAFDQTAVAGGDDTLTALTALPGIERVFRAEQIARLAALAPGGGAAGEQVVKQVAIVVAERRNYDPDAARDHLARHLPPARLLVVDTVKHHAIAVAELIATWL